MHKLDILGKVIQAAMLCYIVYMVVVLITQYQPRLPPGAVFQTNPAKEWRVVMSDGQVTPVRTKIRAAELAWDYWEVNQCPTNERTWKTVR